MKSDHFKEEMKTDLKRIKKLIKICRKKEIAIKIEVPIICETYWIEKNKHAIELLKKEYKLIKKKLKWTQEDY